MGYIEYGVGALVGATLVAAYLTGHQDDAVDRAATRKPAKDLIEAGLLTREHLKAAAQKGINALVDEAQKNHAAMNHSQDAARRAIETYLEDRSKPPVITVPHAASPATPAP